MILKLWNSGTWFLPRIVRPLDRPAFSKPWTQYYRIFKFFSYYAFISYSATGNIIYDIDCKDFNQRKHSDFQKHTPGLGNDREEYPRTRLQLVVVLFLCTSFLLQFKLAILKSYCQEQGKTTKVIG